MSAINSTGSFTFLGTGGSMGIPVIGCYCPVCQSDSPFNQRLRPSGLLTFGEKKILIDCGPDFRQQALHYKIDQLSGLILTHAHHDHVAGVDELRVYYMRNKETLPCLLSEATLRELKIRYHYIFDVDSTKLTSRLKLQILEQSSGMVPFLGIPIQYASYEQGGMVVNGFRIGDFAYFSDIKHYSDNIFDTLKGVTTLVLSALRFETSPCHLSVDEAIIFAERVGAQKTWFTHIAHELDHDKTNSYLPENVRMAYDGLKITITV